MFWLRVCWEKIACRYLNTYMSVDSKHDCKEYYHKTASCISSMMFLIRDDVLDLIKNILHLLCCLEGLQKSKFHLAETDLLLDYHLLRVLTQLDEVSTKKIRVVAIAGPCSYPSSQPPRKGLFLLVKEENFGLPLLHAIIFILVSGTAENKTLGLSVRIMSLLM